MRTILTVLVLVGIGLVVIYYTGGYASFDPSEQGRQAKAALWPGMPFGQACDITGDPKTFRIINQKVLRIGGEEVVTFVPAPLVKITRERIETRLAEGSLPHGFLCTFNYSTSVAFTVRYDGTGAVVSVGDAKTMPAWSLLDR